MGVNQQQSTNTTATKGSVVQPLQFDFLKQESSSNRTNIDCVEEDRLINDVIGIHEDNTVKLHRSKRYIKTIIDVFRTLGPQRTAEGLLLSKEIADLGMNVFL